jgi:hypothetical protein
MKHTCLFLTMATAILMVQACERTQNILGPGGGNNNGPIPLGANFASVQSNIFTPSCALTGCHVQGGVQPSLEAGRAYNNLVGVTSSGYAPRLRVMPGNPNNSVLYQKIIGGGNGVGGPMPPGGMLAQAQMDTIRAWILKGAKNDGPVGGAGATLSQLQAQIINQNCTGCHVGAAPRPNNAPFSLESVDSTYANLVNRRALRNTKADSIRVLPGRSDLSYLIRLLQGNGEPPTPQMPPLATQNKLSPAQIQQIQSWIDAGALKN